MMYNRFLLILFSLFFIVPVGMNAQADEDEFVSARDILVQGSLYEFMGKYEKAISLYKKGHPNDTSYAYISYRLASCYSDNHEDSLCLVTAQRSLNLGNRYKADFYNLIGISYREMSKYEKAYQTFDQAIALYPNVYYLFYNKGMTYVKEKKYNEAVDCFQKAIDLNQYSRGSHFQLGKALVEQGRLVPALLAFEFFLVLESTGERANKVVVQIEDMYGGEIDSDPEHKVSSSEAGDGCFDDLVELLESKKALNPSNKNLTKLKYKFVMQRQFMFDRMKYDESSKNWFMQNYVPFFVNMQKNGYYVPYTYHTLSSVNDKAEAKGRKKNKSKIQAFIKWGSEFINEHSRHPLKMAMEDRENVSILFHDNNVISGIGKVNPKTKKPVGKWTYFHERGGLLRGTGQFDDEGEPTGVWEWYSSNNGILAERTSFKEGKLNGKRELYYDNGSLKEVAEFKDDLLDGSYTTYNISGGKNEEGQFTMGKLDGVAKNYFPSGKLKIESSFKEGKIDKEQKLYFSDGSLSRITTWAMGVLSGTFKDYYSNNKILSEGKYQDGFPVGAWKYYHFNGKLSQEGEFAEKGLRSGKWKGFHSNGAIETEATYNKKGELNGDLIIYDEDGVKYKHDEYKNGDLVRIRYYNKKGELLEDQKALGKRISLIDYYPIGVKRAEGELVNGKKEGEWKFFDREGGWLREKYMYAAGEANGESTIYFANGKVSVKCEFKNDERHGYFKSFYNNGQMYQEGWYQSGKQEGEWIQYNYKGVIVAKNYYIQDELFGNQYYYDAKGKLWESSYLQDDWLRRTAYYDSLGAVTYQYAYDSTQSKGLLKPTYKNGKTWFERSYVNGVSEGKTQTWYFNGKLRLEAQYENGELEGKRIIYFDNGKVKSESNYKFDKLEGISNAYFEDGALSSKINYVRGEINDTAYFYYWNGNIWRKLLYNDGDLHGIYSFYSPDGSLSHVRYYDHDMIIGYSYLGKDGKLVDMIPLKNGNGTITAYFANGNKSIELTIENGQFNGKRTEYYSNGTIACEENNEYGIQQGLHKYYYSNGQLRLTINYSGGYQDGETRYYYENGNVKRIENWILDDRYGETLHFNESGQQIRREYYRNDWQLEDSLAQ